MLSDYYIKFTHAVFKLLTYYQMEVMIILYHIDLYIVLLTKISIVVDVKLNNNDRCIHMRFIITYNQFTRQICTSTEWRNFNINIWLNNENVMVILALATQYGMGISQWKKW